MSNESLQSIESRIQDPKLSNEAVRNICFELLRRVKSILMHTGGMKISTNLPSDQYSMFQEIAAVEGSDAQAQKKVQRLLMTLQNTPATELLTHNLSDMLRARRWGILIEKKFNGTVHWGEDPSRKAGGRMQIMYRANGKTHCKSFSKVPELLLTNVDLEERE